jgi:exosortase
MGPAFAFDWTDLPWRSWLLLLGCGVIAFGPLTSTWNVNSNYSYGWWIPVVSMILFAERWPTRPARANPPSFRLVFPVALGGILFLAFRLAAETDPDWRPGLWVLVSLYVVVLLTWLWLEGGRPWVHHFAFPIGFLFLSVPWLYQIEFPLVQGLMRWNAALVADSLQCLGIAAEPAGNIIQLQNCRLGVEEACSGILSLQASLVMGCLLGDIYGLTVRRRFFLVGTSMMLALLGNYFRTLFLALMAVYVGADAVPQWHDTAGYAILVFTALGSWLAALYLSGTSIQVPDVIEGVAEGGRVGGREQSHGAVRLAVAALTVLLLSEALTQAWYGWRELHLAQHPSWTANLPVSNPSFKKIELSPFTIESLRCDEFKTGQWQDTKGWHWTAFWLRYEPKPYTRSMLNLHTPDQCLPTVGLTKAEDMPIFSTQVKGLDFNLRPKVFLSKEAPVYVFWLIYSLQGNFVRGDYLTTLSASAKIKSHLRDIWEGYRGVGVETLEVAIVGPNNYDDARAAFLSQLNALAAPVKTEGGTSR